MPKLRKSKINILTGLQLGMLTVGDLVRFVQDHPLFLETPISYLQQGRLREVLCECGTIRLISESILATGRLKSCGCYRQSLREKASQHRFQKVEKQATRKILVEKIRIAQAQLVALKSAPSHAQNKEHIAECSKVIKHLMRKLT